MENKKKVVSQAEFERIVTTHDGLAIIADGASMSTTLDGVEYVTAAAADNDNEEHQI